MPADQSFQPGSYHLYYTKSDRRSFSDRVDGFTQLEISQRSSAVEQWTHKPLVTGANPVAGTKIGWISNGASQPLSTSVTVIVKLLCQRDFKKS